MKELKKEIEEIKSDDTFVTISSLDDWDEYFEELKKDLEEEKEKLEVEAQEILEDKEDKELDSDLNIVQDILKEQTIDSESCISTIKYLSTSEIARQHNMQAKPHLFDELLELKLYLGNTSFLFFLNVLIEEEVLFVFLRNVFRFLSKSLPISSLTSISLIKSLLRNPLVSHR